MSFVYLLVTLSCDVHVQYLTLFCCRSWLHTNYSCRQWVQLTGVMSWICSTLSSERIGQAGASHASIWVSRLLTNAWLWLQYWLEKSVNPVPKLPCYVIVLLVKTLIFPWPLRNVDTNCGFSATFYFQVMIPCRSDGWTNRQMNARHVMKCI